MREIKIVKSKSRWSATTFTISCISRRLTKFQIPKHYHTHPPAHQPHQRINWGYLHQKLTICPRCRSASVQHNRQGKILQKLHKKARSTVEPAINVLRERRPKRGSTELRRYYHKPARPESQQEHIDETLKWNNGITIAQLLYKIKGSHNLQKLKPRTCSCISQTLAKMPKRWTSAVLPHTRQSWGSTRAHQWDRERGIKASQAVQYRPATVCMCAKYYRAKPRDSDVAMVRLQKIEGK